MKTAPLPINEEQRLATLLAYNVLDTGFEEAYHELAELAARVCAAPIALISLLDVKRQWFKARIGIDVSETERDYAFCAHAILQEEPLIVEDALHDERFVDNPLVTEAPYIRFYAGVPLKSRDGYAVGTLCVIDRQPRSLTPEQLQALLTLAHQVVSQLELRLSMQKIQQHIASLQAINTNRDRLLAIISHDLRQPMHNIVGITEQLHVSATTTATEQEQSLLGHLQHSTRNTLHLLDSLLQWARMQTGQAPYRPDLLMLIDSIESVHQALTRELRRKQQQLTIDCADDIFVYADVKMLHSILQNLLSNAIKFSPKGSTITLQVIQQSDAVDVIISDCGLGMTEERLSKLFVIEQHYATEGTDGEMGAGLGLILAQQMVAKNNGRMWLESHLGKGTQAHLRLNIGLIGSH